MYLHGVLVYFGDKGPYTEAILVSLFPCVLVSSRVALVQQVS